MASTHEPPDRSRRGTRLLSRSQVASLLELGECIDAVEEAFRAHAAGRSIPPAS